MKNDIDLKFLMKPFYVALVMLMGYVLAMVVHAFIEMWLINELLVQGAVPVSHPGILSECYLPNPVKYGLATVGVVAGFFLGRHWWNIVYVKKTHKKRWFSKK